MLLSLFAIGLLLGNSLIVALVFVRQEQHRQRAEELASAILATLTADDPREIDPALGRVLDARDLTDDELMAEVRRRNGGLHEAEEQS